jgi:hypothetical protein
MQIDNFLNLIKTGFDTVESNKVIIFSIFIKEVLDDDVFYSYNWVNDYKK